MNSPTTTICLLCDAPATTLDGFCDTCYDAINAPEPTCRECGNQLEPWDREISETTCIDCLERNKQAAPQVYLEQLGGEKPVPCDINLISYGPNFRIRIDTGKYHPLLIKCDARTLVKIFEPIVDSAKASTGLIPPGIIRSKDNGSNPNHVSLISIADIANAETDAEKWALLIEHFKHSPAGSDGVLAGLLEQYKRVTGRKYNNGHTQLDTDLARIRANLHQVRVKPNGQYHRGDIAKALGVSAGGTSYQERVLPAAEVLEAEKTSSSSIDQGQSFVTTPAKAQGVG